MKSRFTKYSDRELLILVNERGKSSEGAFNELYRRYSDILYNFCFYMLGEESAAQDIFQETFVNYLVKANPNPEKINVKAYLLQTAKHLCINYKKKNQKMISADHEFDLLQYIPEFEDFEMEDVLKNAIDMLEDKYKEAFILREIEELSYKEIGKILDISWSGAQSRVVRAKKKLMKILKPYIKNIYI